MPNEPLNDALLRSNKQGQKSTHTNVSVGVTATQILPLNSNRKSCVIFNNSAVTVFVGPDNTVTTGNGLGIPTQSTLTDPDSIDAWFGIVASGTADVRVIEVT